MSEQNPREPDRRLGRVLLVVLLAMAVGLAGFVGVGLSSSPRVSQTADARFDTASNPAADQYCSGGNCCGHGNGNCCDNQNTSNGNGNGNGNCCVDQNTSGGNGNGKCCDTENTSNGNGNCCDKRANGNGNGNCCEDQSTSGGNGGGCCAGGHGDCGGGNGGGGGRHGERRGHGQTPRKHARRAERMCYNAVRASQTGTRVRVTRGSGCQVSPVDARGHWSFQFRCNQRTPCRDVAIAAGSNPRRFTVAPHHTVQVHMTLSRSGMRKLSRQHGTAGGRMTVRSGTGSAVGRQTFHLVAIRHRVW
jgi:hypothetical protein